MRAATVGRMRMINQRSRFEERHVLYCDLLGFSRYSLSEFFEPAKCFQLFARLDRILADASVTNPDRYESTPLLLLTEIFRWDGQANIHLRSFNPAKIDNFKTP
jgi:hypothetical protein